MTEEENKQESPKYGAPLVIINTIIILLLIIFALVCKNGAVSEEVTTTDEKLTTIEIPVVIHEETSPGWVTPHISEQAKIHILYGDETGGAHFHTVTTPCKSIFPKDWSADKIIEVTEEIAANDNLDWKPRRNGNMYAKGEKDGIWVGVIMDSQRKHVITSFPLNAGRNPCPSNEKTDDTDKAEETNIEHKYNYNQ